MFLAPRWKKQLEKIQWRVGMGAANLQTGRPFGKERRFLWLNVLLIPIMPPLHWLMISVGGTGRNWTSPSSASSSPPSWAAGTGSAGSSRGHIPGGRDCTRRAWVLGLWGLPFSFITSWIAAWWAVCSLWTHPFRVTLWRVRPKANYKTCIDLLAIHGVKWMTMFEKKNQ